MNFTMRRLIVRGVSVMAFMWATRLGVASPVRVDSEAARASRAGANEIQLPCGGSRTYNANSDIHFIEVVNPDIAEITGGGKELTVNGLREGTTKATIWYAASERPVQVLIRVLNAGAVVQTAGEVRAGPEVRVAAPTSGMPLTGSEPSLAASKAPQQQLPAISLESSDPVTATVGKMAEHRIVLKNVGAVPAEQVEVRGRLSIDSELISTEPKADVVNSSLVWRIGRMPAGEQQTIVLRVKPLVAGELSCQTNVSFKPNAPARTQAQEAKLKLVCEAPTSVTIGNEVRLVMTISNIGNAAAERVRIHQVMPGVVPTGGSTAEPRIFEVGTLQPGKARSIETSSIARESGVVRINLVAQTDDGSLTTVEHVLRVTAPRLAVKATGPESRYLNRRATYQFTLANPGDAAATNVNLMVGLPEGLEYLDADGEALFNPEKRTIAWSIGSLASQERREFTVNVVPKAEGQHLQRAVAWADGNLVAKADKITRVEGMTSLVMEINDVQDPIQIGSETVYQIHVMNRSSKEATRVQVAATVPDGMMPLSVESNGQYRIQGQQIQFETIASLGPQSSTVFQVHVKGTAKGTQRFRAVMASPALPNPVITEEPTEVIGY